MCFSATASFSAAGILGLIGAVSLKKIKRPSEIVLAAVPMLFALQQISEGLLWLALTNTTYSSWKTNATHIFLFFAQFLWPIIIPLALYTIEEIKTRKKILFITFMFGVLGSAFLGYRLVFYDIYAEIEHHHIRYEIGTTHFLTILTNICYVISIVFPFFISGLKHIKCIGFLLVSTMLVTRFFYTEYFISIWCYCAALLSISIIYVMNLSRKENNINVS